MKESNIQQLIRMELSRLGARIWRNNSGMLRDANGTPVRYGLCVGSSDLIGIYKGRFIAIEVKQPNKKPTSEQVNFIRIVRENGGLADVLTSERDCENFLKEIYKYQLQ